MGKDEPLVIDADVRRVEYSKHAGLTVIIVRRDTPSRVILLTPSRFIFARDGELSSYRAVSRITGWLTASRLKPIDFWYSATLQAQDLFCYANTLPTPVTTPITGMYLSRIILGGTTPLTQLKAKIRWFGVVGWVVGKILM